MHKRRKGIRNGILAALLVISLASCGDSDTDPTTIILPGNRYSVIISGGRNMYTNGSRYWNECSLFYKTLKKNGVPDENIYVIISDGTDPAEDANVSDPKPEHPWGYTWNSPVDLDGDGRPDTRFSATRENVAAVFDELASIMTSDDILYIYTTGHGGPTVDNPAPYSEPRSHLGLWGDELYTADEMAAALEKIQTRAVVGIFSQCNGGGFVEQLAGPNRVLMSASRWWETSYALWQCFPELLDACYAYDEFAYYALTALNDPLLGDASGDNTTSMEEAYLYGLAHDSNQSESGPSEPWAGTSGDGEHPSYYSNPWDLGRQLSLQGLRPLATPPAYAGFTEMETTDPYPAPGAAQYWHADSAAWQYRLPFSFPFGGASYDTVHISVDGIISFAGPNTSGENCVNALSQIVAIAPHWDDLTTEADDADIFIDENPAHTTIEWKARTKTDNRKVQFAARLYVDGAIIFYYGDGNDLTSAVRPGRDKTIGLSTGEEMHLSLRNGRGNLGRANPVTFILDTRRGL